MRTHRATTTTTTTRRMSFDESAPIVTSLADGKTGKFNYLSANPFEFRHILQSHPPPPQQILQGELQMPTRRQPGFEHKPVPCVVGMHGSWGWGKFISVINISCNLQHQLGL